jgi:hypothetical protein
MAFIFYPKWEEFAGGFHEAGCGFSKHTRNKPNGTKPFPPTRVWTVMGATHTEHRDE